MTTKEIKERIGCVIDPVINKTLAESNAIKHVGVDPEKNVVVLILHITKCGGNEEKQIRRELAKIIKLDLGFTGIKMQIDERRIVESIVNKNVKFIIIASGKGGVGKSTVAANLAYALSRKGKKVGIIDADIYGSSIPKILEMTHAYPRANDDGKILPLEAFNMQIISTEFFAEEGRPIIWRGAMLNSMMNNFFYEVKWDKDLDYMIIDSPPGTGDIHISLVHDIPLEGAVIVSTPQDVALADVEKGVNMFRNESVNKPIFGLVENMAWFTPAEHPDEKYYIFGQGGGLRMAEKYDIPLLGQIPIVQSIRESGDAGEPAALSSRPDGLAFLALAEKLAATFSRTVEHK